MTVYTDQLRRLKEARAFLAAEYPYFSVALWAMRFVEVDGRLARLLPNGIAVDKYWRVYFDPDKTAEWYDSQVTGAVAHELYHLLRNHAERCALFGGDAQLWNLAADLEINDELENDLYLAKVVLPPGAVRPGDFKLDDGQLAEDYYKKLEGLAETVQMTLCCGSCSGNSWEGEVPPPADADSGVDAAEAYAIVQTTADAIKQQGDVPGEWKRWAETALEPPKINWEQQFARHVRRAVGTSAGLVDYSYARPSPHGERGLIFPGLVAPEVEVAEVLDSSASMSDGDLALAVGTTSQILQAVGFRYIRYYCTDAAVHVARRITNVRNIEIVGRGGTDMRAGIEAAIAGRPRPHVIVVITDGWTPWPERRTPVPIIAALTPDCRRPPSWIRYVRLDNNDADFESDDETY